MSTELAGKVAIVTGGANGLGRGTVELYLKEGAKVVFADLDEDGGQALATELGNNARFKRADVSSKADMQALIDYTVAEFGGLDIMFNNAGITDHAFASLLDLEFDQFDQIMRVNVLGVMLGTQLAARHMVKNGGGSIINNASIGGVLAGHGFPTYRASKAAVISFSKCAAIELGEHLIRVNTICPGNVITDMASFAAPEPGMTAEQSIRIKEIISEVRMKRQPLKRQAYSIDIAQTAVFLGSDRSQQMTGQVLSVDGGATAGDAQSLIAEMLEARKDV